MQAAPVVYVAPDTAHDLPWCVGLLTWSLLLCVPVTLYTRSAVQRSLHNVHALAVTDHYDDTP